MIPKWYGKSEPQPIRGTTEPGEQFSDAAVPAGIDEMRRAGIGEFAVGKSRAEMAEGAVAPADEQDALVAEDDSEVAREVAASGEELHAPRLMAAEIANALWRKARLGEIEPGDAGAMLAAVAEMPVRWGADEAISADAVRIALALDRPVYDCVYLALAHRIGAAVISADLRFANALAPTEHGEAVMTLADYTRIR